MATRRVEVEEAARRRAKAARRADLKARVVPELPRRRRRYGALSTLARVQLVALFLFVQLGAWLFLSSWRLRFAVALLTVAVLLVAVKTRRSPSR